MYGNRLVRVTAYQAALGKYNDVDEYLKAAEQLKNPEMIQKWRKYYHTFILPLDQKVCNVIMFIKNATLFDQKYKIIWYKTFQIQTI